jgi:hypothetical protein
MIGPPTTKASYFLLQVVSWAEVVAELYVSSEKLPSLKARTPLHRAYSSAAVVAISMPFIHSAVQEVILLVLK